MQDLESLLKMCNYDNYEALLSNLMEEQQADRRALAQFAQRAERRRRSRRRRRNVRCSERVNVMTGSDPSQNNLAGGAAAGPEQLQPQVQPGCERRQPGSGGKKLV